MPNELKYGGKCELGTGIVRASALTQVVALRVML